MPQQLVQTLFGPRLSSTLARRSRGIGWNQLLEEATLPCPYGLWMEHLLGLRLDNLCVGDFAPLLCYDACHMRWVPQ